VIKGRDVAQVNSRGNLRRDYSILFIYEKYDGYDAVESITITVDDENIKVTKFNVGDECRCLHLAPWEVIC
jgi:hypothetical protein